ncbi:hypothetical protein D3C71_1806430 [compost metagenome]
MTAEYTPTGIATVSAMNIASRPSSKVTGRRSAIMLSTESPCHSESPRSPWKARRLIQMPYCCQMGLSRPSVSISWSRVSLFDPASFWLSIRSTTSPGTMRTITKTMMLAISSVGNRASRRRRM